MGSPSLGSGDPFAQRPRRIVARVLVVPALELGDPMMRFVLVETDDPPLHP